MIIEINKSKKQLRLVQHGQAVFTFPCAVGKDSGRKLKAGDLRTPEGEYLIVVKNPKSKYYLSLGLNYPSIKDARDAHEQGMINEKTRNKIIKAQGDYLNDSKTVIPWDTKMGGEIYIHGELDNGKNYSLGCIKLFNKDIKKLYNIVEVGMRVVITT